MTAAALLYGAGTRDHDTFMPLSGGARWDLLDPDPNAIVWRDVAIRLARTPRCAGAMTWSLAEHSLLVMKIAPTEAKPYALLHDAHEAFLGDWVTPVKAALITLGGEAVSTALGVLERRSAWAIHGAANLPFPPRPDLADAVAHADAVALATERRDVLDAGCEAGWGRSLPAPLGAGKGRLRSEALNGAQERVAEAFLKALVDVVGVAPEAAR